MTRQQRLEGNRYHRLVVQEYVGKGQWKCLCDCGNYVTTVSYTLKSGNTKSCGCYKKERTSERHKGKIALKRLPDNQGLWNQIYRKTKKNAVVRNIEWQLTPEDVRKLGSLECNYCSHTGSNVVRDPEGHGSRILMFNGIDRLDSNKGYTLDNVVPCCKTCNLAKHVMNEKEFYSWVGRVASKYQIRVERMIDYAERD